MKQLKPEAMVLRAVTDLLSAEHIWWCRMNSGMTVLTDQRGKRRVIAGHRPGTADVLAAPRGTMSCSNGAEIPTDPIFLWIECKSATGKQSPAQVEFQREVEAQGHLYMIARSSDDVLAKLRELGCTSTESHPRPTRYGKLDTAF